MRRLIGSLALSGVVSLVWRNRHMIGEFFGRDSQPTTADAPAPAAPATDGGTS